MLQLSIINKNTFARFFTPTYHRQPRCPSNLRRQQVPTLVRPRIGVSGLQDDQMVLVDNPELVLEFGKHFVAAGNGVRLTSVVVEYPRQAVELAREIHFARKCDVTAVQDVGRV